MYIIRQTPRLIIREFLPGEEEVYLHHFTDPDVVIYLPKRSRDERSHIFRTALGNYNSNKQLGTWGMFDKENGEFVGSCLLRLFEHETGKIELGYSMDKKYWGMGLGSEMAAAMVAHSFENAGTLMVVGVTDLANIASQRVLQKAGLRRMDNLMRDGEELAYFVAERK